MCPFVVISVCVIGLCMCLLVFCVCCVLIVLLFYVSLFVLFRVFFVFVLFSLLLLRKYKHTNINNKQNKHTRTLPSLEFENAARGDLARVVSQWGDTRNPKVGPNQIIARVKTVNAVERALPFCPVPSCDFKFFFFVVGPGTRSPRCIK